MTSLSMIVGLGNPGAQYAFTRHNIGFLVLERVAQKLDIRFKIESRLSGALAKGSCESQACVLLLPTTYMNLSGMAVRKALNFFRIPFPHPRSLLVVTDDVYLPFGKMRMRSQGSAGGHNGLESINQELSSREFWRLRVGVGPFPPTGEGNENIPLKDFVLLLFLQRKERDLNRSLKQLL